MSLTVNVKYLENLPGKGDRFLKIKFRDSEQTSKVVKGGQTVYMGQSLVWPLARRIDSGDILELTVYTTSRFMSAKFIGKIVISLQELEQTNHIDDLTEQFTDGHFSLIRAAVSFGIDYVTPEGVRPTTSIEEFDEFNYPIFNLAGQYSGKNNEFKLPSEDRSDDERTESEEEEDLAEGRGYDSDSSLVPRRLPVPAVQDATLMKAEDYQVSIMIYEARQLVGFNINPQIQVMVGDEKKETVMRKSTNKPQYNQLFVFDFCMPKEKLLDEIIRMRVRARDNYNIFNKMIVGDFKIDIRYVCEQPNHGFEHKWAVLLDTKDIMSGEKGFVLCDIFVLGKGQNIKKTVHDSTQDTDENIEKNLLVPTLLQKGKPDKRDLSVKIFRGEDLPCMNTSAVTTVKRTLSSQQKDFVDPFVEVSFAGHSASTKTMSNKASPEWNQEVVITEDFPPLCHRIRFSVWDSSPFKKDLIATHFIDLTKIMDKTGECAYTDPNFGPAWINLYGNIRNHEFRTARTQDELNCNLGEGVAYRGRIMISISSTQSMMENKRGYKIRSFAPCEKLSRTEFFLFSSIFEASVISEDVGKKKKPISFEMSIGNVGNKMDAKADRADQVKEEESEAKDDEAAMQNTSWDVSTTTPMIAETDDDRYYYLPINKDKPCLYMKCKFEDTRPCMAIPNILEKLIEKFSRDIEIVSQMIYHDRSHTKGRLFKAIKTFHENATEASDKVRECRGTGKRYKLDNNLKRWIRIRLKTACAQVEELSRTLSKQNLREKVDKCREIVTELEYHKDMPVHGLPDIFIWMIKENKRFAYARVPSRDILHSNVEEEMGKNCSKLVTLFLRFPGRLGSSESGWPIQCMLRIYMWLGLFREYRNYRSGLPVGFSDSCFPRPKNPLERRKYLPPPKELKYEQESYFELRCYLYMGRELIGSDESGLSDPFVRIILNTKVVESSHKAETLNPQWDETLRIEKLVFRTSAAMVKREAPVIIVEVYDEDLNWIMPDEEEFIGRCFCQPHVFIKEDQVRYERPKLEFWQIYRAQSPAGELLAAFELVETTANGEVELRNGLTWDVIEHESTWMDELSEDKTTHEFPHIPQEIRPTELAHYRLEALFWGVRELKKGIKVKEFTLIDMDNPQILVDVGGGKLCTGRKTVEKRKRNQNFKDQLHHIDLHLPKDIRFWPPLHIHCDNLFMLQKTFRRDAYPVGNHVEQLIQFYDKPEPEFVSSESESEDYDDKHLGESDVESVKSNRTTASQRLGKGQIMNAMGEIVTDTAELDDVSVEIKNGKEMGNGVAGKTVGSGLPGELEESAEPNVAGYFPGTNVVMTPRPVATKEALRDADWWLRYYATVEFNLQKKMDEEEKAALLKEEEAKRKKVIAIEEDEEQIDEPEEIKYAKKETKKKKKRKKKKKKKKKPPRLFRKDPEKEFKKELEYADDLELISMEKEKSETSRAWVEKFEIYPCPLEEVPKFEDTFTVFDTFTLHKGKELEDQDSSQRVSGRVKAKFKIYNISEEEVGQKVSSNDFQLYKDIPKNCKTQRVSVRVYIIRGLDLHPMDPSGLSDPYLLVRLGEKKQGTRNDCIPNTLNPEFGRCFEFTVKFPQDSLLKVAVWDRDILPTDDDLIGETEIDLENRLFSKHRPLCGIPQTYYSDGYAKWRDAHPPTFVLDKLCKTYKLPEPDYNPLASKITLGTHTYYAVTKIEQEGEDPIQSREPLALAALNHWEEIQGFPLVPEHIETRPLYGEKSSIEQGRLEMWVDMFINSDGMPPAPINIEPRKPVSYELRVIIHNCEDVEANDTNFITGEMSSDIFVRGWIKGRGVDDQQTDVHYRSLSGEGNFNWRFIFPFDYLKAEDKVTFKTKGLFDVAEKEERKRCVLWLQVWDADLITSDDILGKLELPLTSMPRGSKFSKACSVFQVKNKCVPRFSLFKNKKARGWWPFIKAHVDSDDEDDKKKKKKKKIKEEKKFDLSGKVDAELHLLLAEEAEQDPAGKARDNPQALPFPNRPDSSFLSFLNPLKILKYLICVKLKWFLIKLLIVSLLIAILVLFLYSTPGNINRLIFGV